MKIFRLKLQRCNGLLSFLFLIIWCACACAPSVTQSCPTLSDPMDCSPPGASVHGIFPGENTSVGCHFLLRGIFPIQGSKQSLLRLLQWLVDSLPVKPQGKPKNTSVGSHSLLQGIFQTQGLNLGLLHWRQILYSLSHQGSPERHKTDLKF